MSSTTVNFNLKTAGFANYANQTLTFKLLQVSADKADDTVILPGIVTATSAANGTGSAALFTTGESDIESTFEVIFPNREKGLFKIPATSAGGSINLSDLLVDHVPGGADAQQSTVYDAAVAYSIQRGNHTGQVTLATAISDAATFQLKPSEGAFVNGDKTKLNGIETGATADQTNAEIRAAVEAATDSNVFTDNEKTKLTNIDTDVTTLSLPASTTINDFAKNSLLNSSAVSVKAALDIADAASITNFVPNSITFPTTSDFLSIANDADLNVGTGDFTLSFWARLDSSGTQPVLDKFSGTGYSLKFSSGSLVLTMQDSGGPLTATFGSSLDDNKWHIYVVSVDRSGNAVAYIDNIAQTAVSVTAVDATLDNTTVFRIGFDGSNAGSGIALGNYVSLHKGVNGALTASQAAQIYFSADAALTLLNPVVAPSLMVDLRKADKTFADVSASPLAIVTNGSIRFNQDRITSLDGVGDINCSSISADVATTGLNVIFDGTDTGDNKITLTDNLASALDITESTNSYLKFTTTNTGEKVVLGKDLDISGDHDLIIGTSTGTKIGTAATQKIGFFNTTPIVQPAGSGSSTVASAGSGATTVKNDTTFQGTGSGASYTINDIVKALKELGLLA